jgi:hypothetical protein
MIDLDVRRNFFVGHGTGRDEKKLLTGDGTGQKKRRPTVSGRDKGESMAYSSGYSEKYSMYDGKGIRLQ